MMSQYRQYVRSSLSQYKFPDVAERDIVAVFNAFTDLRPKLADYVFNNGTTRTLLQLDGTIPVTYRGSTYNIPIAIWLMDTHPYNPPLVYVKPTSSMQIKSGPNVDSNGKVYITYLSEWIYPNSYLLELIQILAILFGEEPPVYSRVVTSARLHNQSQEAVRTPNHAEQDSDDEELSMLREELRRVENRKREKRKEDEKKQLRREVEKAKAELQEMEKNKNVSQNERQVKEY
ncbi:hypothetical protein ACJMK2_041622 [Sinanodonta woodiana]|uniref:UEV domain-containing protein n=1 Tax=Sinanodonta woodiana TaxID=1069815 RepID=A0ABD3W4R6_SINWO